jgi:hypothetical protein
VLEVQAGFAYLWGIWPSGRTVRVVTAAQAAGAQAAANPESAFVIQILSESHRIINTGPMAVTINVAPGRTADGSVSVTIPPNHYMDATDVDHDGDASTTPRVHLGPPKSIGGGADGIAGIRGFSDSLKAKKEKFQDP